MGHPFTERYERLINARNYHYTNFNVWMVFFLMAEGGLFAGYYTFINSTSAGTFEQNIVGVLGYAVSLFWHWACKGYYWWIENWIALIFWHEQGLPPELLVYSCFANKENEGSYFNPLKSANISTSKVVLLFSFSVSVTWLALLLYNGFARRMVKQYMPPCNWFAGISIAVAAILITILLCGTATFIKSNVQNHKNIATK